MVRIKESMNLIRYIIFITLCLGTVTTYAQGPQTVGGLNIDYKSPKTYEIGPIRVEGADNYDHNAIKLLAGLRQGQSITIPGEKVSTAIKNLWDEGLFSNVEIQAEKEIAGVIYLVIKLTPRPKLSRFKFIGVKKRDADKIREEISLFSGKTITENLVFATKNGRLRRRRHSCHKPACQFGRSVHAPFTVYCQLPLPR